MKELSPPVPKCPDADNNPHNTKDFNRGKKKWGRTLKNDRTFNKCVKT